MFSVIDQALKYRKRGKIRWAKLSHFSQFSRALQKFSREYIRASYNGLFKCCKRKALRNFSCEKLHWVESAKSLAQRIFPRLWYSC